MRPATDSAMFAVCDPLDSDAASIRTAKSDVSPAAATACGVNLALSCWSAQSAPFWAD
jgi:hypothetical protein